MMLQVETFDGKQAIARMDVEELEIVVSKVFAKPVTVLDWQVTLLGGLDSSPFAGGVYRVDGTACTDHTRSFCLVVKILRSPEGFTMPDGRCITRGMAEDQQQLWLLAARKPSLPNPIYSTIYPLACACHAMYLGMTYAHQRPPNVGCGKNIFPTDHEWTWDDYYQAAYRLGQWQGYSPRPVCPITPGCAQDWLAGWVHGPLIGIFGMVEGMNGYQHPVLNRLFCPRRIGRFTPTVGQIDKAIWINWRNCRKHCAIWMPIVAT